MPIYEYDCLKCGTAFEELVSSADEKVRCDSCGSARVKRRFSVFSVAGREKSAGTSSGVSCGSCVSRNCSTCR